MTAPTTWISIILLLGVISCGGDSPSNDEATRPAAGDTCYSPTQNLNTAYDNGATGCACGDTDEDQCVTDSTGIHVALICSGDRWLAVEDGPCMPLPTD